MLRARYVRRAQSRDRLLPQIVTVSRPHCRRRASDLGAMPTIKQFQLSSCQIRIECIAMSRGQEIFSLFFSAAGGPSQLLNWLQQPVLRTVAAGSLSLSTIIQGLLLHVTGG